MVVKQRSNVLSVELTTVETKMITRLRESYQFKSDRELVVALIKRACLTLDVGK